MIVANGRPRGNPLVKQLTHVHGTRANSYGDSSGMANLSAEEPYALI
jgi:hypothetical protein